MYRESDDHVTATEPRAASRDRKLARLVAYLDNLSAQKFTGNLRINLTQGRIGRVEKYEEVLK